MADTVLVRFNQQKPDELEWLCVEQQEAPISIGEMAELAKAAQGKRLILLLPATSVLLQELELPVKANAQIKKALPFALEDRLADDIENYHLVWHKQSTGKLAVAIVSHEKMITMTGLFDKAGIELAGMYPESLCLPYQADQYSLLIEDQQASLRASVWQGWGIDVDALPVILPKLLDEGWLCQSLRLWSNQAPAEWMQSLPLTCIEETFTPSLQLFASGFGAATELNLLAGDYAIQSKPVGRWQHWMPVVALALLALMLQVGALLNKTWQQQDRLQLIENQSLALFKQTFPDVKRIVNVKAQADQQLIALKKQAGNGGSAFMRLLYRSGEIFKDFSGLEYQKLNYANAAIQLQIKTVDIAQLEQLKQQLQSQLQVKVLSADSGANGVEAQLEIREK